MTAYGSALTHLSSVCVCVCVCVAVVQQLTEGGVCVADGQDGPAAPRLPAEDPHQDRQGNRLPPPPRWPTRLMNIDELLRISITLFHVARLFIYEYTHKYIYILITRSNKLLSMFVFF